MPKVIHSDENIQPRARIYLNHKGSNIFDSTEYICWITLGSAAYKEKYKTKEVVDQDRFTEFLKTFPVDN